MGAGSSFLSRVDLNKPLDDATLQKIERKYDKDHTGLDKKDVDLFLKQWGAANHQPDLDIEAKSKSVLEQYEAYRARKSVPKKEQKDAPPPEETSFLTSLVRGAKATHLSALVGIGHLKDGLVKVATDEWAIVANALHDEKEHVKGSLFEAMNSNEDPRLDYWTAATIKIIAEKQYKWTKPPMSSLKTPTACKPLTKVRLHNTELMVPTEDEDWDMPTSGQMMVAKFLRSYCPMVDDISYRWLPEEDKEAYIRQILGSIWPRTIVYWNDRVSDDALERLAFLGIGQAHLAKLPESKWPDAYYGIELDFMQTLDVRPRLAKYGASAYFSKEGKVVRLVRGGQEYLPGCPQWEYVKMCFRGSLITCVTAVDHLLGIHAIVSNFLTTTSREQLSPNHPLRRLIKPFTFRSAYINYSAGMNLFSPGGFLHRAFALSEEGMAQTWKFGWATLSYEPFPDMVRRMQIDTMKIPLEEDGVELWAIFHEFVSNYVYLYYPEEQALCADAEVRAFMDETRRLMPPRAQMGNLNRATLVEFLTYSFFMVSAGHNFLGTVAEYVADPDFCPTVWLEEQPECEQPSGLPVYAVRAGLIMTATGFPQPRLLDDFSGVMLDDKAKAVCREFREALTKQAAVVDKRNLSRRQPFQALNPRFIELAVSI